MSLIDDLIDILKRKRLLGVSDYERTFFENRKDRRLRHRLKKKLINNLYLLPSETAEIKLLRDYYVFVVLKFYKKDFFEFGQKLLKKTVAAELFELSLKISQSLILVIKFRDRGELKRLSLDLLDKIKAEHLIILNYREVLAGGELITISPVSYRSAFHYYFNRVCYWEQRDQKATFLACQTALTYFEKCYSDKKAAIKHFLLKSCIPAILSRGTNQTILQYLESEPRGTKNWLNACIYHAIFWAYQGDYQKTISICQDSLKIATNKAIKEQLLLVEAWASLLTDRKFKFSRFLNDLSILTKQKSDINAGLIFLKMAYWIKQKEDGKVMDAERGLKNYARRYLFGRMLIMYKILFVLIGCNFNQKVFIKESINLFAEIKEGIPLAIDIEPVPFPDILDYLFPKK